MGQVYSMENKSEAITSGDYPDSEDEFEIVDFPDDGNPQTWLLCVDGQKDLECDLSDIFDLSKPAPPEFNVRSAGDGSKSSDTITLPEKGDRLCISSETITLSESGEGLSPENITLPETMAMPMGSETMDDSPQEADSFKNHTYEIISPEFKENLLLSNAESLSFSELELLTYVPDSSNRMSPLSTSGSNIKRFSNDNKIPIECTESSNKMPAFSTPKTLFINSSNKHCEAKKNVEPIDLVINTKTFIRPKKHRKSIVQELTHRYCPDIKSEDEHLIDQKYEVSSHRIEHQASGDQSTSIPQVFSAPPSPIKADRVEDCSQKKNREPLSMAEHLAKKMLMIRRVASVEDVSKPSIGLRKPAFFSSTLDIRKIGPAIGNADPGSSSTDPAPLKPKGPATRSKIPVPFQRFLPPKQ